MRVPVNAILFCFYRYHDMYIDNAMLLFIRITNIWVHQLVPAKASQYDVNWITSANLYFKTEVVRNYQTHQAHSLGEI